MVQDFILPMGRNVCHLKYQIDLYWVWIFRRSHSRSVLCFQVVASFVSYVSWVLQRVFVIVFI